ncbi:MAG: outer membrane lipoprotein-sorting protein [Planctomycetes bacterium]|nr:outer membrane lipoprotein-sorting protein [Planctomycetota bacterium]
MNFNPKIKLTLFTSMIISILVADILAQTENKLPSSENALKIIKMYESEYKFKKADVKVAYEYKKKEVSFSYKMLAKNNGERTLLKFDSPKSIKGQAMLKSGFSYVWKLEGKEPFELTAKQLLARAWKSLLFYRELPLSFDFRDAEIAKIDFLDKTKTKYQIELKCSDKYINGFEKAVLTFNASDNVLEGMEQFWSKSSDNAREFKFAYEKVGERRALKKLEVSYPEYNLKSTVSITNIEFPEKINDKALDLPGAAGYLTSNEIIDKLEKMEDFKAMKSTGKQVIYKTSGTTRTLEFESWSVNNGEKQLMKYLKPADISGDKILMLNDGDDIFVYFHLTGRIKNIATSMRNSSVMNSDFSYQDMAGGDYREKYTFRLLKKEELDSKMCYRMEAKPTSKGPSYEKVLYWIDIKNFRIYKADYYAKNKPKPIKRLLIEDYKIVKKHHVPMKITMENLETGSKTIMETTSVDYPDSLPDSLFSKKELKR